MRDKHERSEKLELAADIAHLVFVVYLTVVVGAMIVTLVMTALGYR